MKQIYVRTTNLCNLRCKHCYMMKYRNKDKYFDEVKVCSWIDEYLKYIKDEDIFISLHGGEPLMCPNDKILYLLNILIIFIKNYD